MNVTLTQTVDEQRLKDLLCNAIEGGSNYWCASMDRMGGVTRKQAEYRQDVPFVSGGWLEVVDGEDEGKKHRLDRAAIEKGLQVFAEKYPKHFADMMAENDDATTGDVFLQCCIFGDAIYG
jgi:hypothetical protein